MLVLKGHQGRVRSLSFSADGQLLASAGGGGRAVSVWRLAGKGGRSYLSGHPARVAAVVFAPVGELLASRDAWGGVRLWDVPRRSELAHWFGRLHTMFGHAFTPDGRQLVVGQNDGRSYPQQWYEVKHLDVATGEEVPEVRVHSGAGRRYAVSLAYSLAGDALAVATADGQIHLWGLSPVGRRGEVPYARLLNALAFSPDGRLLAVAAGKVVRLWSTGDVVGALATLKGHTRVVTGVAFTPDGRLLASASTDGQVKLWDLAAAQERAAFDWQVGPVTAVALSPDGMRGACGGVGGDLAVWDLDL
jgi:WD40 repeat protein